MHTEPLAAWAIQSTIQVDSLRGEHMSTSVSIQASKVTFPDQLSVEISRHLDSE
jgi:hypothetical protein